MRLTEESLRLRWLILAGTWVIAATLATLHALAFRDYVELLTQAAPRQPAIATPMQRIIPTNYADVQTWVRYALAIDGGAPWQVRFTADDNAPFGREVHWNSPLAHALAAAGRWRAAVTGEPVPMATERVTAWFNLPVFLAAMVVFSAWAAQRAGAGAGVLVAVGMVGSNAFYEGFAPNYVDHHGLITAATFGLVLGTWFMGGGWWRPAGAGGGALLPESPASARRAAIGSALCGAAGMWISAASLVPAIAIVGAASVGAVGLFGRRAREDGAEFEGGVWRLWGRVGAAASLVCYLIEYAPSHLGWRMEVNHPLYALAWWGGSELVARLGEGWLGRTTGESRGRSAWRWLWPVAAVVAPLLVIVVGGAKVFLVLDPIVAQLPSKVAEGLSLIATGQVFGTSAVYYYLNWNAVPLVLAGGLLWRRQADRVVLAFGAAVALAFTLLLVLQVRWSLSASGPLLGLLVAVTAVIVAGRRAWVRWAVIVAFAGGVLAPSAIRRIEQVRDHLRARAADRFDLQQLLYRDIAAALRASQPAGDIVVLASPNASTGIGYYGQFKTVGTLYWENAAGLRAAAEIFGAPTTDAARALVRARGITHIVVTTENDFLGEYFSMLHPGAGPAEFQATFGSQLLYRHSLPPWLRPLPYRPPQDVFIPNLTVLLLQVVPDQSPAEMDWSFALVQLALGLTKEAGDSFETSTAESPAAERPGKLLAAGNTCYQNGAPATAVRLFRTALELSDDPVVAGNLAWVLATCRDDAVRNGREALAVAERLCARRPDEAQSWAVLAAALAENARFAEAAEASTRAIKLAHAAGDAEGERNLTERLAAFQAGRPWRQ